MSRSTKSGFLRMSKWPYQYTRGSSAFAESDVGAVLAAEPNVFAGEYVGMGPETGAAEMDPGTDHPP